MKLTGFKMFAWIALHAERARLRARKAIEQEAAWRKHTANPANICEECDGFGETPVKGTRSSTGMEMCCYCGGQGYKPLPFED